jgi:hypothetical protein
MSDTRQIQGRDVTLKLFKDGRVIRGLSATKATYETDGEIRSRALIGARRPSRQAIIYGYKGTIDFDIDNGRHHEVSEFLNNSDLSGVPNVEFAIQLTENYGDGSSKTFRFTNVKLLPNSGNVGGMKEDVTGSFTWEAVDRISL